MSVAEETLQNSIEPQANNRGNISLRETGERALARQEELTAIRLELLALAQADDKLRKLLYENRQKHFVLAQRVLELIIN
ncbi:MAG: hypothetical protein QOH63_1958 [Acidobacteriota bacterium]|jgi:hypothetical protein|nr:hypothetical protein [Acidobacteriota bacterium]